MSENHAQLHACMQNRNGMASYNGVMRVKQNENITIMAFILPLLYLLQYNTSNVVTLDQVPHGSVGM